MTPILAPRLGLVGFSNAFFDICVKICRSIVFKHGTNLVSANRWVKGLLVRMKPPQGRFPLNILIDGPQGVSALKKRPSFPFTMVEKICAKIIMLSPLLVVVQLIWLYIFKENVNRLDLDLPNRIVWPMKTIKSF